MKISWNQESERYSGKRERPQKKTNIPYQKKKKPCWADKTNACPPHPTSWSGSKCSLLNAAMLPNPTKNHVDGTIWSCGMQKISLFPACFLPCQTFKTQLGYSRYILNSLARGSCKSLRPAWCKRTPDYDSILLVTFYYPRKGGLGLQKSVPLVSAFFKISNLYCILFSPWKLPLS